MSSGTNTEKPVPVSPRKPSTETTQRYRITITEITCGERFEQQYVSLGDDENGKAQYGNVDIIKQFKEERGILVLEVAQMYSSLSDITALIEKGPLLNVTSKGTFPDRPF